MGQKWRPVRVSVFILLLAFRTHSSATEPETIRKKRAISPGERTLSRRRGSRSSRPIVPLEGFEEAPGLGGGGAAHDGGLGKELGEEAAAGPQDVVPAILFFELDRRAREAERGLLEQVEALKKDQRRLEDLTALLADRVAKLEARRGRGR